MSKYKHIPTKKLKEILDSNYCTGVNGKDYEPIKEELQQILWEREKDVSIEKLVNDYYEKIS